MTNLIAESTTASFTKIATSNRVYQKEEIEGLTSIEDVKQEILISKVERKDASMIEILAGITNEDITEGYYINTLGLYAKDGDENELLYAVAIDDTPDYIDAFDNKVILSINYRLDVKVSNSSQVTLEVSPDAYATVKQIQELDQKISEMGDFTKIEEMLWKGYVTADCALSDNSQLVTSNGEGILLTKPLF